jgi:serine/threonine protein kinase
VISLPHRPLLSLSSTGPSCSHHREADPSRGSRCDGSPLEDPERSLSREGSGEFEFESIDCSSLRIFFSADSSLLLCLALLWQDTPCVLKVAISQEELWKLRKEKGILETIRQRDRLGDAHRYLVSWLFPSPDLLDQERIFFLDGSGDRIFPPHLLGMGIQGLVLESGGCNLQDFLKNEDHSHSSVSVTQRVQILAEIVEAVSFLHKMGIVHFDIKPENVVSFLCGPSQRMRWKLIDFDSSHDISPSSPSTPSPRAVLSWETLNSSESVVCLTKEYAAPEVMKMLDQWMALTAAPSSLASSVSGISSPPPLATSPTLAIDERMDIWSLGLVAFFLFTNRPFWPISSALKSSMVSSLRQEDIDFALSSLRFVDHKELSFLESCLQVDPGNRWSATALLGKSLFSTKSSTSVAKDLRASKEELRQVVGELFAARSQQVAGSVSSSSSSSSLSSEEMSFQFEEFGQWLVPKLEQLLSLTTTEIADLLKPTPQPALFSSTSSSPGK